MSAKGLREVRTAQLAQVKVKLEQLEHTYAWLKGLVHRVQGCEEYDCDRDWHGIHETCALDYEELGKRVVAALDDLAASKKEIAGQADDLSNQLRKGPII